MANKSGMASHADVFSKSVNDSGSANLRLLIIHAQAGEVFRKAFIEPRLRGRIVVVEEDLGEFAGYRAPAFVFGQIQDEVIAIFAGKEEAGRDRLSLARGHDFAVFFIASQGNDVDWFRHVDPGSGQQLREDGAHLLEAHDYVMAVLFVSVSDHGKVTGVDADPVRLVRAGRGERSTAEQNSNQDEPGWKGVDAIRHEPLGSC